MFQPLLRRAASTSTRNSYAATATRPAPSKLPRAILLSSINAFAAGSLGYYLARNNLPMVAGPIDTSSLHPPSTAPSTTTHEISSHHVYAELLASEDYHMLPPRPPGPSLTSGVLRGPKRIEGNVVFMRTDDMESITLLQFGTAVCGYPGVLHGGISATVLDESMGRLAAFTLGDGKRPVTARLEITYRRPVEVRNGVVVAKSWVEEVIDGRKVKVRSKVEGADGQTLMEGNALFVLPKGWQPPMIQSFFRESSTGSESGIQLGELGDEHRDTNI